MRTLLFSLCSFLLLVLLAGGIVSSSGCRVYRFNDVSIPDSIRTVRVNLIENRARYRNPQLAPTLTDRLRQKITNQTRLSPTTSDNAHYDITATITEYNASTSGIANTQTGRQTSINRLTVSIQITLNNTLSGDKKDYNVTRNFDYDANQTLQAAETRLLDEMVRNLTDEIFNRIFSNW